MKLLIIRHAESRGNASGDYSVLQADSLSDRGEEQAQSLAEHLQAWPITRVIVSSMKRAQDTVSPYLTASGLKAEIWPELAEACWQEEREDPADSWGSGPAPIAASDPSLFAYRNGEAVRHTHPESFGQGLRRVHAAADRVNEIAGRSDDFVLMVTHGHFIREILNLLLGTRAVVRFPHENCGMTLLSFDQLWMMEFCNRTMTATG